MPPPKICNPFVTLRFIFLQTVACLRHPGFNDVLWLTQGKASDGARVITTALRVEPFSAFPHPAMCGPVGSCWWMGSCAGLG